MLQGTIDAARYDESIATRVSQFGPYAQFPVMNSSMGS
jgi:hypothetical protein